MKLQKLFIGLALVGAVSCASSKAPMANRDIEVEVPCAGLEYLTSAEFFRANASGVSNSLQTANMKAMQAARATLASAIETTVKTVTDSYVSSYEENANEESRSRFQSLTREVVNQRIAGVSVICQKTMQTPDGKYKSYVAIELSGEDLAKEMGDKISADSKLRTDFEYEKFKEVFEKEMEDLANE